jgi:hypothetical protein
VYYVYVPYADKAMDKYADFLVDEKNKTNWVFGKHQKIDRDKGGTPLSVVGWCDRLYVLVHGTGAYSGVCVNTNPMNDDEKYVTGEDFAGVLVNAGLKNTTVDVRLWTCWGGNRGTENWHGPDGNDDHRLSSFALRVACGFKERRYTSITVVGYRKLVNLSEIVLKKFGGHKVLQDHGEGDPKFMRVRDADRATYKVSAI